MKLFSLLLHNCNFATGTNCHIKYLCFLMVVGDPVKWLFSPKGSHGLRNTCFLTTTHSSSWMQKHSTPQCKGLLKGNLGKTLLKAFGKLPGPSEFIPDELSSSAEQGGRKCFLLLKWAMQGACEERTQGDMLSALASCLPWSFSFFMGTSSSLGCYLRFYT